LPSRPASTSSIPEMLLGQALQTLGLPREQLIVATKSTGSMDETPNGRGQSRHHIFNQVDASLGIKIWA
jgi:aryl-alcohol dehydrogenase-like predicted oxidoreductase